MLQSADYESKHDTNTEKTNVIPPR